MNLNQLTVALLAAGLCGLPSAVSANEIVDLSNLLARPGQQSPAAGQGSTKAVAAPTTATKPVVPAAPTPAVKQAESVCTPVRCQAPAKAAPAKQTKPSAKKPAETKTLPHEQTQAAKVEPVVEAVNQYLGRSAGVITENGMVRYPYGQMEPVLVCAPLRVCTIEMEPGEQILNVATGDTARWQLFPTESGSTTIVGVKTLISESDPDITTNTLITTNKRVYTVILKSSKTNFVPRIGFYYPQDAVQTWTRRHEARTGTVPADPEVPARAANPVEVADDGMRVDLSKVNTNYVIEGDDVAFKPTRVFDDGQRLYIELPKGMQEMPALFVDEQIVNFRSRFGYLVVDRLGKTTSLILGVGRDQQRVDITRGRTPKKLFGVF